MSTSNIGRLRFFLYSLGLSLAEGIAIVLCIAVTIGFTGLINSSPGPSRQGMAGVVLIVSLVFVALRGNFAWRRSRDAAGPAWILWSYIVFSAIYAFLQAGVIMTIDLHRPEHVPGGMNLLGLAIFGLWVVILWAKPVAGSDINELTSVFDFDGTVPSSPRAGRAATGAVASAPRATAPATRSTPAIQSFGRPRPAGFGKRGL